MGLPAKQRIEMKDFPGLVNQVDPHDINPGAARAQENLICGKMGELITRSGYRPASFDVGAGVGQGTPNVIAMFFFVRPQGNFLVQQLDTGEIVYGSNPTLT